MKHSLRQGSGYLIIDHKDSPGINIEEVPERLRNKTIIAGAGKVEERDVQNCSHCQRAVVLEPLRVRSRGYCNHCHHYICDECEVMFRITLQCVPFKKVFDAAVNRIEKGGIVLTDM